MAKRHQPNDDQSSKVITIMQQLSRIIPAMYYSKTKGNFVATLVGLGYCNAKTCLYSHALHSPFKQ